MWCKMQKLQAACYRRHCFALPPTALSLAFAGFNRSAASPYSSRAERRRQWGPKAPPLEVRYNKHRLGSRVIEPAAELLAGSFDLEAMVLAILATCAGADLSALRERSAKRRIEQLTYSLVSTSRNCGRGTKSSGERWQCSPTRLDGRSSSPRPCYNAQHHPARLSTIANAR